MTTNKGFYIHEFDVTINDLDRKKNEQNLIDNFWWKYNNGGGFYGHITKAIVNADSENLEKLYQGFPKLVDGYSLHRSGRKFK